MKHCLLVLLFCCSLITGVRAIEPALWWKTVHGYVPGTDWYEYLTYTSAFMGPNALPVPEVYDGRVPEKNRMEVSADVFWGNGDRTQSLSTRWDWAAIPGRLSLSGWGVLAEHYHTSNAVRDQRASLVENPEETLLIGDLYLSALVRLLRETSRSPQVNLEVVLKTAASKTSAGARYMDTPGYLFNVTAAKSWRTDPLWLDELRAVVNLGFLCYQLNGVHQNDAPVYGAKLMASRGNWTLEGGLHGYTGWTGKGDAPQVIRLKGQRRIGTLDVFLQYQHALRDYPYRRLQAGICVNF